MRYSLQMALFDTAAGAVEFAVNWLVQSTLLIIAGLIVGHLLRRPGSAVQSAVYRTTLVAVLVCPLATSLLSLAGVTGWSIAMPRAWTFNTPEVSVIGEPAVVEYVEPAALEVPAPAVVYPPNEGLTAADSRDFPLVAFDGPESESFLADTPIVAADEGLADATSAVSAEAPVGQLDVHLFGFTAVVLGVAWLGVSIVLLVRLAIAWWRLTCLRCNAVPADEVATATCREVATQLAVRPPDVLESVFLPSPCLAGLSRPAVLLPESAPVLSLRDVLIHELAHLRRRDCHWNLLRQLASAVFFFQPLLWVLSRRLEATAEEVCDDYVVQFGGDRHAYAHRLVDIAELSTIPCAAAGVGIVSLRSMLAQRVARITDPSRRLSTRVGNLLLLLVLAGGLIGTTAVGLVGLAPRPTQAEAETATDEGEKADETATDEATDNDNVFTLRGRVVDPEGQPVVGATVRLPNDVDEDAPSVRSDANGRFEITYDKSKFTKPEWHSEPWQQATVMATVDGFGPAWLSGEELFGPDEITLQLVNDLPLRGQILDLEGRPVAHAEVEVWSIQHPYSGSLDKYLKVLRDDPNREQSYRNNEFEWIWSDRIKLDVTRGTAGTWENDRFRIITDDEGRFEVRGIGDERLIRMHVAGEGIESLQVNVITRPEIDDKWQRRGIDDNVRRMLDTGSSIPKVYPATFQHLAGPSFPVTGVVRDKDSGEPIPGILVAGWLRNTENHAKTTTDENGRYVLKGLAAQGTFEQLYAGPSDGDPDQLPYVGAEKERLSFSPSDPLTSEETDFELARGIVVRGRVTDAATGEPVKSRVEYLGHGDNPHLAELPIPLWPYCDAMTNDDGEFSIVVLPGPGSLAVWTRLSPNLPDRYRPATPEEFGLPVDEQGFMATTNKGLIRADSYKAARLIDFKPGEAPSDIEFKVHPVADVVRIRCVDEQDQIIRGVSVAGHLPWMGDQVMRHGGLEVGRGEDTYIEISDLEAEDRLPVAFYYHELELAAILFPSHDTREPQLTNLQRDDDGAYRIMLRPWATITGRLIDAAGEPVARGSGLEIALASAADPMKPIFEVDDHRIFDDGRFELTHIPAGGPYLIGAGGPEYPGRMVRQIAEVKPGETIDLGTIDITSDVQPEAKTGKPSDNEPDEQVTMRGRVVDEAGRPVPSAKVLVVRSRGNDIPHGLDQHYEHQRLAEVPVDRQGRFEVGVPVPMTGPRMGAMNWRAADLIAVAPGYAPQWVRSNNGPYDREVVLKLNSAPVTIRGRLLNLEGQPVEGLQVRLAMLAGAEPDRVRKWVDDVASLRADGKLPKPGGPTMLSAFVASAAAPTPSIEPADQRSAYFPAMERLPAAELALPATVRTDKEGRFEIAGLAPDHLATLVVSGPGIANHQVTVITRAMESMSVPEATYYGVEFDHVVPPGIVIEGVVRDVETGEPLAGAAVKSYIAAGPRRMVDESLVTTADEQGRFRLEGLPIGKGNELKVVPAADQPYLITERLEVPESDGRDPVEMEIAMRRGVFVSGRVTDAESGAPVEASVHIHPYLDNPHAEKYQRFDPGIMSLTIGDYEPSIRTQSDGSFRIVAPPGRSILAVFALDNNDYCVGLGAEDVSGLDERQQRFATYDHCSARIYHRLTEIDIAPDAESVTYNLSLSRGRNVLIETVDPEGRILTGVRASNRTPFGSVDEESPEANLVEVVALRPDEQRPVLLLQQERKLARVITVEAPQTDTATEPRQVELQPCATVTGWLVDGDGEPIANMHFRAGLLPSMDNPITAENVVTKEDGSFRFDYLAPGGRYMLGGYHQDFGWIELINELEIKPGETIDLGAIDATSKERPEPVRTAQPRNAQDAHEDASGDAKAAGADPPVRYAEQVLDADGKGQSYEFIGIVVDADGKPVGGADVAVTAMKNQPRRGGDYTPNGDVLAQVRTNSDGEFSLTLEGDLANTHTYSQLIARKEGVALGWRRFDFKAPPTDVRIELRNEEPIRGRLVDIEGQPAAGVRLNVQAVVARLQDGVWNEDGAGFRGSDPPAAWLPQLVTDDDGRFTVRSVPAGYGVILDVADNDRFAPQDIALNTGMPEQRGERDGTYRSLVKNVQRGEEAVIALDPAQVIEGTITYEDTGEPAPHARVTVWASQEEYGSMKSVAGQADENGRYRVSPNPGIRFGVTAYAPDGVPYMARQTPLDKAIRWEAGDRVRTVDMSLPRGVLVRGKVTAEESGEPIAGASIKYLPESENNPNTSDDIVTGWQGIQVTDEQGEFAIAVLPGPGRLLVHGPTNDYVVYEVTSREIARGTSGGGRVYAHLIYKIDVDLAASPVDVTLSLEQGATVRGTLVDETGHSVDHVTMVTWLNTHPTDNNWRGRSPQVVGGRFELSGLADGEEYPVHFLDPKRKLGATAIVRADQPTPEVVMRPCGAATMRLVDQEGEPCANVSAINVYFVARPGADMYDSDAMEAGEIAADSDFISNIDRTNYPHPQSTDSDAEGRIGLPVLIPGATYRIVTLNDGRFTVVKDFVADAGETLDLGDLVVDVVGE